MICICQVAMWWRNSISKYLRGRGRGGRPRQWRARENPSSRPSGVRSATFPTRLSIRMRGKFMPFDVKSIRLACASCTREKSWPRFGEGVSLIFRQPLKSYSRLLAQYRKNAPSQHYPGCLLCGFTALPLVNDR